MRDTSVLTGPQRAAPPSASGTTPPGDTLRPSAADTPRPRTARASTPRDVAPPERPLRLFVALDLPDHVRDALAALGAAADGDTWRPVAPAALHLTLAFLGARPPGVVARIAPIVEAEREAPRIALRDLLLLPPRRARVLTVALDDPAGALRALQARVSDALQRAGVYTPEARPFRPHVTVARLRPRARAPRSTELAIDRLEFSATAVTLYASRLHPKGARYEPLVRSALG